MTSKVNVLKSIALALVFSLLGACSDGETDVLAERVTIEDLGIASINVASSKDIIAVAEVITLTAVEGTSGSNLANTVTWVSSDTGVATVEPGGVVTGLADGNVTITAGIGGVEGSTTLAVSSAGLLSIEVSSAALPIDVCTSAQFAASGTYADGRVDDLTDQVAWISAAPATADFDATSIGQLNTIAAGTVDVTASLEGITSPALSVVVSDSLTEITATLADTSINVGATTTITASGNFSGTQQDISANSTFASATTSVATVDESGAVTAVAEGTSIISASCNALQGNATLSVTDTGSTATLVDLEIAGAPFQVSLGTTLQLFATAEYSDMTTEDVTEQATWVIPVGTSNAVFVSNVAGERGLVTPNSLGTGTVRATFQTEDVVVTVQVVP